MANEIQVTYDTGATLYALVFDAAGQVWQLTTNTFVAYAAANIDNYDMAMSEIATNSEQYRGTFDSDIAAGVYSVVLFAQAGGSPDASADERIGETGVMHWNGSEEIHHRKHNIDINALPTATENRDAILDREAIQHIQVGTVGRQLKTVMDIIDVNALAAKTASEANQTTLGSPNNFKADVTNLDVAVSTRSSHSAADVTGGTTVAAAETNIRGADSDTLKTLSDQMDSAGLEYGMGLSASYDGTTAKLGLWLEESGQRQTDVTSITDVEIWNAATDAQVVDLGDDSADSADGVFYFSGAASLAYNTPYYVKATVNKGGSPYAMQAGLVRI